VLTNVTIPILLSIRSRINSTLWRLFEE